MSGLPSADRLAEIERMWVFGVKPDDVKWLIAHARALEAALVAASEDARILVQDYYSGLPEHRRPVDGAVARLAHLFERDDEECEPRTVDEIIAEGLAARAALPERKP